MVPEPESSRLSITGDWVVSEIVPDVQWGPQRVQPGCQEACGLQRDVNERLCTCAPYKGPHCKPAINPRLVFSLDEPLPAFPALAALSDKPSSASSCGAIKLLQVTDV